MPRDLPDWGALNAQKTVHEITDLGELAVRLGSIVQFDRRGDVVYMDDFEGLSLNGWKAVLSGSESKVELSTLRARSGIYSALLTAGGSDPSRAGITHYMPYPVLSAFGLEASISRDIVMGSIRFEISLFNGVTYAEFVLRWNLVNNEVSYQSATGAWIALGEIPLITENTLFHTFKLVIDGVNNNYVRVIVNNTRFLLIDVPAYTAASGIAPSLYAQINLYGDDSPDSEIWVADPIITQNEPT